MSTFSKSHLLIFLFTIVTSSFSLFAQEKNELVIKYNTYNSAIDSLYKIRKISEATLLSDELIAFAKSEYGTSDSTYANALAVKSECYIAAKKYAEALELEFEVLSIRRKIPGEEIGTAEALNTIYRLHKITGQLTRGSVYLFEAMGIVEKRNPNDPDLNILYNNAGVLYRELGDFETAEEYYMKGWDVILKHYGEGAIEGANLLNNLGGMYQAMGNYKQSEYYFLKLYALLVKVVGDGHPKMRSAINNLAVVNRDLGNYEKAEAYFLQGLQIDIRIDTVSYIAILQNLATLYNGTNQFEKAQEFYYRSLDLQIIEYGPDHGEVGGTYFNLGSNFLDKKDPINARDYYTKSLEIRKRVYGENHYNYGASLLSLSRVDFFERKKRSSIDLALSARNILLKSVGDKHYLYESTLHSLADYYTYFGHLDSAEQYFVEALNIQYTLIKEQFSFTSEMEKENYIRKISGRTSVFFRYGLKRKLTNPAITGNIYDYILNTKGLLLKSSTLLRNTILEGEDAILKDKYEAWINLKKKVTTVQNTPIEKRKEDLKILEDEANSLEKELVRSISELDSNFLDLDNSWLNVKADLKSNEAAVEFLNFQKSKDSMVYCALIIKPTSIYPEMIELFEEKQLQALLGNNSSTNYKIINTVYGNKTQKNSGLYDLIWKPLETILGKAKKVFVSPSGLLHKISFAGLMRSDGNYLSDELSLDMMATTADISKSTHFEITPTDEIGLFGGIQYSTDSSNSEPWAYLNGTKTESDALAKTFKLYTANVNYMSGANATKSNFISLAEKSAIIHIATHGFFFPDPHSLGQSLIVESESGDIKFRGGPTRAAGLYTDSQNPLMRSGLVFAGANDYWNGTEFSKVNNGVLTAMDVLNIDLRKNKLVIMSACESGLGDIVGGEGVYGLRRAFKMAGTDFIIMSLWQVPDKETAEFMTTFYQLLFKRKDIAIAFSETQKIMRKKYDPYFWAAFVLQR